MVCTHKENLPQIEVNENRVDLPMAQLNKLRNKIRVSKINDGR